MRGAIVSLIMLATLAISAPAQAALALTVVSSISLPSLSPGSTSTTGTPTTLSVTAPLTSWTLTVADSDASSAAPGHMLRTSTANGCSSSESYLQRPLHLSVTNGLAATIDQSSLDLSGTTPVLIAHGTTTGSVSVSYSQPVAGSEQLQPLCPYGITLVYTLS